MKNGGTHNCLDTMGRKSGEDVGLSYCHGLGGNQVSAVERVLASINIQLLQGSHI